MLLVSCCPCSLCVRVSGLHILLVALYSSMLTCTIIVLRPLWRGRIYLLVIAYDKYLARTVL